MFETIFKDYYIRPKNLHKKSKDYLVSSNTKLNWPELDYLRGQQFKSKECLPGKVELNLNNNNRILISPINKLKNQDNTSDWKDVTVNEAYDLPSYKEWSNDQYFYNRKLVKYSPSVHNLVRSLVKSYFNLSLLVDGKKSKRITIRFKRLSLDRILSGKPEIKQTNNKAIITLYVYNRNKKYSFLKLKEIQKEKQEENRVKYLQKGKKQKKDLQKKQKVQTIKRIQKTQKKQKIQRIKRIQKVQRIQEYQEKTGIKFFFPYFSIISGSSSLNLFKSLSANFFANQHGIEKAYTTPLYEVISTLKEMKKKKIMTPGRKRNARRHKKRVQLQGKIRKQKQRKIKRVETKSLLFLRNIKEHKNLFMKAFKLNDKYFDLYKDMYLNNYLEKLYKREVLYVYYMKVLSRNNIKYKNWFLLGIKNIISNVLKKNVEFNIVNLKYLHYNSSNLTEAIDIKLRKRDNRLLRVLKKTVRLSTVPYIDLSVYIRDINKRKDEMQKIKEDGKKNKNTVKKGVISILERIKHKTVNGIRMEATGRLSRRLTASRSVFKYKYRGTLKNIDSSYRKLPSIMSRGYIKQNIQDIKVNSKTRNGAFGLKGWISSY